MTQYRYRSVLTNEGAELHGELGFRPQSVTVDNVSASWAFVPEGGRYIPPFQYGVVLPLVGAGQTADVLWRTPPGLTAPTLGNPLGQLTAIYTDAQLAPSNGQSVVVPSQQVPCLISTVTTVTGAGSAAVVGASSFTLGTAVNSQVIVQVTLPPGANSIMVLGGVGLNAIPNEPWTTLIQGVESGALYYQGATPSAPVTIQGETVIAAVVSSAADQHIQINLLAPFGFGFAPTFRVVASYATQAVQVEGAGPGANPVPVVISGTPSVINGVAPQNTSLQVATISATIAASTNVTIIAAPGGSVSVHIFQYAFDMSLNAFPGAGNTNPHTTIGSTSGAVNIRESQWIIETAAPANFAVLSMPLVGDLMGLAPLPVGEGLRVVNGSQNILFTGHIVYAVY